MCLRADQLQAAPPRDGADPRRRRGLAGVRVSEDRRNARERRNHRWHRLFRQALGPAGTAAAHHRSRDAGVAVLHQRDHRPIQGCDAVAPQPDGDDRRPPRGFRCAGRELQPCPRCADVARFGSLHSPVCAARRAASDPRIGRVRADGVPGSVRAPSRLQRLSRPHHGPAPGADRTRAAREICGRWCTAVARCTWTA